MKILHNHGWIVVNAAILRPLLHKEQVGLGEVISRVEYDAGEEPKLTADVDVVIVRSQVRPELQGMIMIENVEPNKFFLSLEK